VPGRPVRRVSRRGETLPRCSPRRLFCFEGGPSCNQLLNKGTLHVSIQTAGAALDMPPRPVTRPRFGALGKHGSLAVLERAIRTVKEGLRRIIVPTKREAMRTELFFILDWYNHNASPAHPNEALLAEPEAMLVINAAKTILHYLDNKLTAVKSVSAK
jgi:hypothetical protein